MIDDQSIDKMIAEECQYGPPIDPAPEPIQYPPLQPQWEPLDTSTLVFKLWGAFLAGFVLAWYLFERE
jgi:hypothetical protein